MSWRDPVIPLAVEQSGTRGHFDQGAKRFLADVDWTLSERDWDRIREGYVCLNCMEPQEQPFPERCSLCRYGMREHQQRHLNEQFEGEKHIGPSTTLQWELDRLDDETDRRWWRKHRSIYVPPGVRL